MGGKSIDERKIEMANVNCPYCKEYNHACRVDCGTVCSGCGKTFRVLERPVLIVIGEEPPPVSVGHTILAWPFKYAPDEYKALSTAGGDEDWVAFVPDGFEQYPHWLHYLDMCRSPQRHNVPGGHVVIGGHV